MSCHVETFDNARALELCKQFLAGSWNQIKLEQFVFEPFGNGQSNRLFICSLRENSETSVEPCPVLIRLYGGNCVSRTFELANYTSPAVNVVKQTAVFIELANHNLGPELYGLFEGGRLEQYIPSHEITNDELSNRDVNAAIAKKLAAIHNLRMPIKKSGGGIVPLKNFYDRTRSIDVDALPSELHKEWFNTLKELDVASELDWIFANYIKINSKVVFCLNDMNRKNIIVKDDPMLDWFDRIYLIDSEYATYSPRAKDIMSHFIHRTLDIDSDDIPYSGVAYPSDSQRRHFIETYLSEVKDKDDHLDSFDHLWLECEFYKLGASLSVLFMATALYLQTKPNFLKVAVDYMKMYKEDKRNFLINYGHLLS